jgi:hypothetical protein
MIDFGLITLKIVFINVKKYQENKQRWLLQNTLAAEENIKCRGKSKLLEK